MTRLAKKLVETALKDTQSWKQAQEQMRVGGGVSRIPDEITKAETHKITRAQSSG